MTFSPRSRATIRDALLANLQARYRSIGIDLLIEPESDAFMLADAYALELEALEQFAAQLRNEILPDKASTAFLNRHGYVDGVDREPATKGSYFVRVTGVASATVTFGSSVLQSPSGNSYVPSVASVVLNGSGYADVTFNAAMAGTTANLPAGAVLSWSSTPTNANPSATVQSVTSLGEDQETDANYAKRIIARRQERPGSGNRADWAAWVDAVSGVAEVYVYERLNADTLALTLGCVTVVPLAPGAGDAPTYPTNPRIPSAGLLLNIERFLEGTHDADGNAVSSGVQLRPVTMAAGDYFIKAPTGTDTDVTMRVANAAAYPFPFNTPLAGTSFTATTVVVSGDYSSYANKPMAVYVGTSYKRGGYVLATPSSAVFAAGNTTFTFAGGALPNTPLNDADGKCLYGAPANWQAIREAVFTFIDAMGPGSGSFNRYPSEEFQGRAALYRSALAAAVIPSYDERGSLVAGVPGVLGVTFDAPVADVAPTALQLVTLRRLTILPA